MPKAVEEKILKSETIFEGKEIRVRRDTIQTASGAPVEKAIVERPDEVLIIPQISSGEILLVKQFRRGVREILLELPGGKVGKGLHVHALSGGAPFRRILYRALPCREFLWQRNL